MCWPVELQEHRLQAHAILSSLYKDCSRCFTTRSSHVSTPVIDLDVFMTTLERKRSRSSMVVSLQNQPAICIALARLIRMASTGSPQETSLPALQYFPDGGMAAAMSTMPGFSIENWAPRAKYVEGAFKMLVAAGWSVRTPGINSLTALNLLDLAQRLTSQLVHNRYGIQWVDGRGTVASLEGVAT